jgi:hypothetical protein
MINQRKWNPEEDKYLAVKFSKKAVHNKFKSEQEGRQVFEDVDWINIRIPGDKTTEVSRKVKEEDKERFEFQWNNYLNREEDKKNGIPLDMLPSITPAQVANLQALRVETIEQLANLHEKGIKNLFEGRDLVKKAKLFLEGDNYAKKLEEEIEKLKAEIKKLQRLNLDVEGSDEPTNNNTKRNKRNTTRGRASNGSGE